MSADLEQARCRIAECDAILTQQGDAQDPTARRSVAFAFRGKVWWSLRAGLDDQAIAASEMLLERFITEADLEAAAEDGSLLADAGHSLLFHRRFTRARTEHWSRWLAIALA